MKKIALILLIIMFGNNSILAQTYKNSRLNIGIQTNLPERLFNSAISKHNDKNGGFGFHVYPKWFHGKNTSFGINMEYALVTEDFQTDKIDRFTILSVSPTYQHYFFDTKIRPFVGLGLGVYHVSPFRSGLHVGIKPLVGVSVSRFFDVSLEYNKILDKININPNSMGDFDNYYVGLKASFSVGLSKVK